jgi:HD-like signal output (HDOD) protein/CheY-like chemotaxis protein
MASPRILLVDEPLPLIQLQRDLSHMNVHWQMEFASSGAAALQALERTPFDVFVTDLDMPDMGGADLLELVSTRFPRTLRFILSGPCDRDTTRRILKSAHQFLPKPCDVQQLSQRLSCALGVRDVLEGTKLVEVVLQIKSLPPLPSLYRELLARMESPSCSAKELGHVIERDMALTSKMLQIVNSAFFGLGRRVSSPFDAVMILGTEVVKSLVISLEIFSQLGSAPLAPGRAERLMSQSIAASRMAQRVAAMAGGDRALQDDCFVAGLLHNIGELVLMTKLSSAHRTILGVAAVEGISIAAAELKVLGTSHAEIGAYLLASWGLSAAVVEAAAWHHIPSKSPVRQLGTLAAVHIADCVISSAANDRPEDCVYIDQEFMGQCGLSDRAESFMSECRAILDSPAY